MPTRSWQFFDFKINYTSRSLRECHCNSSNALQGASDPNASVADLLPTCLVTWNQDTISHCLKPQTSIRNINNEKNTRLRLDTCKKRLKVRSEFQEIIITTCYINYEVGVPRRHRWIKITSRDCNLLSIITSVNGYH